MNLSRNLIDHAHDVLAGGSGTIPVDTIRTSEGITPDPASLEVWHAAVQAARDERPGVYSDDLGADGLVEWL